MTTRFLAACLAALVLAGCETTTSGAAPSTGAQQVKHFSYEGKDVSMSWAATSATLNYDADLALSNTEIASLVSEETGCRVSGAGSPTLIGSRVHLTLPINCARPAADADAAAA